MRTLRVATTALCGVRQRRIAVAVLRWEDGAERRVVVRRLRRGDAVPAAYRALLAALWEARRMRARSVVLGVDDADVAGQILCRAAPPPEALASYLQVRALLNAFRSVEVLHLTPGCDPDAAAARAEAAARVGLRQPCCVDLPLWAAAS